MLNRPLFPVSHQNSIPLGNSGVPAYSGDGQRGSQRPTPSPFVPYYSGDGHGKPAGWTGDGQGSHHDEPMPLWSGDGRNDFHNPLMPTWGNTNGRFVHRRETASVSVAVETKPMEKQAPVTHQNPRPSIHVPLSDELVMNVNMPSGDGSVEAMKTSHKTSGTWKLIALVVVFLVWVSTASTLLFLYMDRYLFP